MNLPHATQKMKDLAGFPRQSNKRKSFAYSEAYAELKFDMHNRSFQRTCHLFVGPERQRCVNHR